MAASSASGTPNVEEDARWIDRCDPLEPLWTEDERYFDLTSVADPEGTVSLRGRDPVRQLRDTITLRSEVGRTSCQLFSGYMAGMMRLLGHHPVSLALPDCHVVYTVPPYVRMLSPDLATRYDRVTQILPAIKVSEPGDPALPYAPGIEALVALVGRRIPLDPVFGPDRAVLRQLVEWSGGHVRTLLQFVREVLFSALELGLPATEAHAEAAVAGFRESARLAVQPDAVPLLDAIRRTGRLPELSDEDLALLARYMDAHLVLCYRNGEGRYEVQPVLRDHIARLVEERRSGAGEA